MSASGYSVSVQPGQVRTVNGATYVVMPGDNVQYKLHLQNSHATCCDAEVTIDGRRVGIFRVPSFDGIVIERPTNSHKRFTFFRGGSRGSYQAGYSAGKESNGLIHVKFTPERRRQYELTNCRSLESTTEGVTGLSGHSDQHYGQAVPINKDDSHVCIMLRLVVDTIDTSVEPLRHVGTPYPEPLRKIQSRYSPFNMV